MDLESGLDTTFRLVSYVSFAVTWQRELVRTCPMDRPRHWQEQRLSRRQLRSPRAVVEQLLTVQPLLNWRRKKADVE